MTGDRRAVDHAVRRDLVPDPQTGELDHAPREVDDADRVAHVQEEHLAAFGHGTGLQDELRRLRDAHEVAGDIGMRDGDWQAGGDLGAEQGHDAAAGTENVSKANHREDGSS